MVGLWNRAPLTIALPEEQSEHQNRYELQWTSSIMNMSVFNSWPMHLTSVYVLYTLRCIPTVVHNSYLPLNASSTINGLGKQDKAVFVHHSFLFERYFVIVVTFKCYPLNNHRNYSIMPHSASLLLLVPLLLYTSVPHLQWWKWRYA